MKIRTTVKINKTTYKIRWVDHFKDNSLGQIEYRKREIVLARKVYSKFLKRKLPLDKEEKLEVYAHEVVHAILRDMKRHDLNNERFVDAFAKRLVTVLGEK